MQDNSYWFLYVHIKTLYETMIIDFLMFTSRPFARQWSLIFLCHIESLCQAMVIDLFTSRPSARQWSLIFLCHIKTLYKAMVMVFLIIEVLCEAMVIDLFTSRPSTRQWSLISYVTSRPFAKQWSSISLNQDPLQDNGHRSLYIKTLYEAMVIDFSVTSGPSGRQWSSISLHQDPLRTNGHWFLSFRYGPSPRDWSNMFFQKVRKEDNKTKWFVRSWPSTW